MKSILLTTLNSRKAGGLFYSVKNLSWAIRDLGIDAKILSFSDRFSEEDLPTYKQTPMIIYHVVKGLGRLGFSFDLDKILENETPEIIHQQGIWMYHSHATLSYKENHPNVKTIITPRGMLDPWLKTNSPIVKKIARLWYEDKNLENADCLHALCLSEYESMRKWGLKNPVAIIPNGTNIPSWTRDYTKKKKYTMLFLSRLDPKKGVDIMLNSLAAVKQQIPDFSNRWQIVIGGWGKSEYIQSLKEQANNLDLNNLVVFRGPAFGYEKDQLLKSVDAFILPSHSEGLPMAILEAWAYGLPVVMTDYCNIPEGFKSNSAYKIDIEEKSMSNQLFDFFNLDIDEIQKLGINGRTLVENHFSWSTIGKQTKELYSWLMGECDQPSFVIKD